MGALGTLEKEAKGVAAVYVGPLEQLADAQALAARERVIQERTSWSARRGGVCSRTLKIKLPQGEQHFKTVE